MECHAIQLNLERAEYFLYQSIKWYNGFLTAATSVNYDVDK